MPLVVTAILDKIASLKKEVKKKEKSFQVSASKNFFFSSLLTVGQNKIVCFSLENCFRLVYYLGDGLETNLGPVL